MMQETGTISTELVRDPEETTEAGTAVGSAELQRICLTVLRAEWSRLVVVATDPRTPSSEMANALVNFARAYRQGSVRALNGEGATAAQVTRLLDALAATDGREVRTVIAVDDPLVNRQCMPLVAAADAALLLVRLGTSSVGSVEATAALVGRERVVGCVVYPR